MPRKPFSRELRNAARLGVSEFGRYAGHGELAPRAAVRFHAVQRTCANFGGQRFGCERSGCSRFGCFQCILRCFSHVLEVLCILRWILWPGHSSPLSVLFEVPRNRPRGRTARAARAARTLRPRRARKERPRTRRTIRITASTRTASARNPQLLLEGLTGRFDGDGALVPLDGLNSNNESTLGMRGLRSGQHSK